MSSGLAEVEDAALFASSVVVWASLCGKCGLMSGCSTAAP